MRSTSWVSLAWLIVSGALVGASWAAQAPVVDKGSLQTRVDDGLVLYQGDLFTGVSIARHEDGALAERVEFVAGRKHGPAKRWYAAGTPSYVATYETNRRHGASRTWWEDGTPRSASFYVDGVADGVQRQWYRSGKPFKEINLKDGRESGIQRAWRENGKLFANYEAKDGRIYGLKRANLCFELEDEVVRAPAPSEGSGSASGGGRR